MDLGNKINNGVWNNTKKARKFVSENAHESQPDACSWCGSPLQSHFTAFAPSAKAAMCAPCIERYAVISRLGILHKTYGDLTAWEAIRDSMVKESRAESSSEQIEEIIANIAYFLARRASSILNGFKTKYSKDPNYGFELGRVRYAFVGPGAGVALAAIRRALKLVGMPVINVVEGDCRSGLAVQLAAEEAMGDPLIAEHVVIAVHDQYAFVNSDSPVIYILDKEEGNIPDDVFTVYLGDIE